MNEKQMITLPTLAEKPALSGLNRYGAQRRHFQPGYSNASASNAVKAHNRGLCHIQQII